MRLSLASKFKRDLTAAGLVGSIAMTSDQKNSVTQEQLQSVKKLTTIMVLACMLNAMVLVLSFSETSMSRAVFVWGGVMAVVLGYMMFRHARNAARSNISDLSTEEQLSAFVRGATILGVLWAIVPLFAIPLSDSNGMTASAMLLTGTMFGGVLLIGRIPAAAMGLVMPIVFGLLAGLQFQQDPSNNFLSVMTLAYAGVLFFASRLAYAQFVQQRLGQIVLEEQTEVIGLLLKDFGESTSDWLWQIGTDGRITPHSVAELQAHDTGDLFPNDQDLLDCLKDGPEKRALQTAIAERRPFRDLVAPIANTTEEAWWSFTGKPLFERGEYQGFRGVAADVTQSKTSEDRIAFLAHYDSLTKLPNRESFTQALTRFGEQHMLSESKCALVYLDLDNFKWINDTMGHAAGDEMLRQVSLRVESLAEGKDLMARISGDEFAMVFSYKSTDNLNTTLTQIAAGFAKPYQLWDSTVSCKASIGVKLLPNALFDAPEAIKHADMARLAAKSRDKGNWALFDHGLAEEARSKRELETDLNRAIENDELRLFFQPQVSSKDHKIVSCEVLLRWQHPQKGLLTPDKFIEFAEDNGVITRIGEWVIRNALAQARQLPDHIRVAVNVSPLQIHSASLVSTIVNALAANQIEPDRLELEITESVMITDTEFTLKKLMQLKELGLRIALDDFGTGFSSLSYLRQFPFDKLKIDKSFIEDISISEDSRAIANATLQLAKALGMDCVGEGVETPHQADFLHAHGCALLQGYMFSRPQPLHALAHLIDLVPSAAKAKPKAPANSNLKLVKKKAKSR